MKKETSKSVQTPVISPKASISPEAPVINQPAGTTAISAPQGGLQGVIGKVAAMGVIALVLVAGCEDNKNKNGSGNPGKTPQTIQHNNTTLEYQGHGRLYVDPKTGKNYWLNDDGTVSPHTVQTR